MHDFYADMRQSFSLRVLMIGILTLVLLIPLAMIQGVIDDRRNNNSEARHDIMRSWGQSQIIGGPILILPYELVTLTQYGERLVSEGQFSVLPQRLDIDAVLRPELRYRGIHKIPVYSADVTIRGELPVPDTGGLGIDAATIAWERAFVALAVSDAMAIRNAPAFEYGDQRSRFEAGGQQMPNLPPQIVAEIDGYDAPDARRQPLPFSIRLEISGTDALQFLALAESTGVSMQSAWPSPSFVGAHLPETREIDGAGFSASWRISNLGRALPSRWTSANSNIGNSKLNAFGVALYMPVSLYHLAERATKYGILFVGLTFICYFLFEVIAGLRLHPLQYLLVGFANTIFYLLLLALAEHTGFGWSYLISSVASSGLITGYSLAILDDRTRALLMLVVLGLLYGLLYLTLKAESFAMLAGSIGLWLALGLIMFLTRRIDWYQRR